MDSSERWWGKIKVEDRIRRIRETDERDLFF